MLPGSEAFATRQRLPWQPVSSSRKTTTPSVRSDCPTASTASRPATTPSAPSNFPPAGTESRCEPVQTSGSSGERPTSRPTTFPRPSTSTSSPASSIQETARAHASSSSGVPPTRFAPTPSPMWKTSSKRRSRVVRAITDLRKGAAA